MEIGQRGRPGLGTRGSPGGTPHHAVPLQAFPLCHTDTRGCEAPEGSAWTTMGLCHGLLTGLLSGEVAGGRPVPCPRLRAPPALPCRVRPAPAPGTRHERPVSDRALLPLLLPTLPRAARFRPGPAGLPVGSQQYWRPPGAQQVKSLRTMIPTLCMTFWKRQNFPEIYMEMVRNSHCLWAEFRHLETVTRLLGPQSPLGDLGCPHSCGHLPQDASSCI